MSRVDEILRDEELVEEIIRKLERKGKIFRYRDTPEHAFLKAREEFTDIDFAYRQGKRDTLKIDYTSLLKKLREECNLYIIMSWRSDILYTKSITYDNIVKAIYYRLIVVINQISKEEKSETYRYWREWCERQDFSDS